MRQPQKEMGAKMEKKTYMLKALRGVDLDSWIEGLYGVAEEPGVMREACAMKSGNTMDTFTVKELETELTCIANRDGYRFDRDGNIVCFDRTKRWI